MKHIHYLAFLILQFNLTTFAQKPTLDYLSSTGWPSLSRPVLSNDGRHVVYIVSSPKTGSHLVLQAIKENWSKTFPSSNIGHFTSDSRQLIAINQHDSLLIYDLNSHNARYISGVSEFELAENDKGHFLIYLKPDSVSTLSLLDLQSGEVRVFQNVKDHVFSKSGMMLILTCNELDDHGNIVSLVKAVDCLSKFSRIVSRGYEVTHLVLDNNDGKLAFLRRPIQGANCKEFELACYDLDKDSYFKLVNSKTYGISEMKIVEKTMFFNETGDKLFFYIGEIDSVSKQQRTLAATVTIRGPNDDILRTQRLKKEPLLAVINFQNLKLGVIRLQRKEDSRGIFKMDKNANWLLLKSGITSDPNNYKWQVTSRPNFYLISTQSGNRRLLKSRFLTNDIQFSTSGRYIIWFDEKSRHWFTYNLISQKVVELITPGGTLLTKDNDFPDIPATEGIAGWGKEDEEVFVYDRHDIWELDPDNIKPAINLTGGYGDRNKIKFLFMDFDVEKPCPINKNDKIILSAFSELNKKQGFYEYNFALKKLIKLSLGDYSYSRKQPDFCGVNSPGPTVKAKSADVFVLVRMKSTEYPNLFATYDFKDFIPLTDLSPQKAYNWYTSQLIRWHLPNGHFAEGILYKPEDFSQSKKYPVIFYYYQKCAFGLNSYINPEQSDGQMNIPWYVSNGYLVFVPDIYYFIGHPGKSAYNSVVSAALYLSQKQWVDSRHMGIQGHSYGGQETNYIVSHTTLFEAAAPASAVSNNISTYGELDFGSWFNERRQGRIGASLWQRPDLYEENSSILVADKVQTPILIMHTRNDSVVPYSQGLQWYNGLNRLGKKVWLLTYEGENHSLGKFENRLDYSVRLAQFFNHFLKELPAPKWMTKGVFPNSGDDGLDLDFSGKQP